jgi:hypothetical protein
MSRDINTFYRQKIINNGVYKEDECLEQKMNMHEAVVKGKESASHGANTEDYYPLL